MQQQDQGAEVSPFRPACCGLADWDPPGDEAGLVRVSELSLTAYRSPSLAHGSKLLQYVWSCFQVSKSNGRFQRAQTHKAAQGFLLPRGRALSLPCDTTRSISAPPGWRAVSSVTTCDSLQTKTRLISGHKEELVQKDHQVYRNFLLAVSYE